MAAAAEQPVGAIGAGELAPVGDPCVADDGAIGQRGRRHGGADDPAVVTEDDVGILAAVDVVVAVGEPARRGRPGPGAVEDPVERRASAGEVVLSATTVDGVGAGVAFDRVVAAVARQRVVALLADDQVVAGASGDPVGAAGSGRPGRGGDPVGSGQVEGAHVEGLCASVGDVPRSAAAGDRAAVRGGCRADVAKDDVATGSGGELVVAEAAEHEQPERRGAGVNHVVALFRVHHEGALVGAEGCRQPCRHRRRC